MVHRSVLSIRQNSQAGQSFAPQAAQMAGGASPNNPSPNNLTSPGDQIPPGNMASQSLAAPGEATAEFGHGTSDAQETCSGQQETVVQIKPLRIGHLVVDPPILQAPMAGFTNYAYRQVVREYGGVGLQATEMVNARGFAWLDEHEAEHPDRLWGVREEPRPLAVQIWDNDPQVMAKVGRRLVEEYQVSVVDINFGCPVKQVTQRAHSGSYLLQFPERMHAIISQLVKACAPTPVTAKIRLGCTRRCANPSEVAKVVEEAGASALTVHGRTAEDYFKGSADWHQISAIKQHLKSIPLIGNGDIDSPEKVLYAFQHYQVDGVMIARAALGRPWLFAQAAAAVRGQPIPPEPSLEAQLQCMLRHFELVVDRFGPQKGTSLMRKYACCYAQGKPGARNFRSNIAHVESPSDFYRVVQRDFPRDEAFNIGLG